MRLNERLACQKAAGQLILAHFQLEHDHVFLARLGGIERNVERECGLGNGTIKRWEEQSPRLDKLVLVSEYLQVSLDYLVFGRSCSETSTNSDRDIAVENLKKSQGLTCDGSPLEDEEADLVAMYRLLPDEQKEDVFDIVHLKYRKHVERKKESIYWTYHNGSSATKSGTAEDAEAQGGTA